MLSNYMFPPYTKIPRIQLCGNALKCEISGISEPSHQSLHLDHVISPDEIEICEEAF